jgi:zinc-dependent metalloproteinase lipoprotein
MWDPNQYVNVFIFTFVEPRVSGRTTLPHTPRQNSLVGLIANNTYYTKIPNFPWGITLNNTYIYESSNYTTLAHELGHYLGLHHVFTTATDSTDYCDDTYTYNRTEYENYLAQNPEMTMQEKYQRKTDDGITFTSYNVMDYYYSHMNQFTADQFLRVRHVLENSPLIPGPKNISVSRSIMEESETPQVMTR